MKLFDFIKSGFETAKVASPLDDVVVKGRRLFSEHRTFERWSLIMTQKYGDSVTPYLANAWRIIDEAAKAERIADDIPKSATLYRMVGPGRFAPASKEAIALPRIFEIVRAVVNRKAIVALAAAVFIVAGLYPPWLQVCNTSGIHSRLDAGYHSIFSPPQPSGGLSPYVAIQIDVSRLVVEWVCILMAGCAAWFMCSRSPRSRPQLQST